MSDRARIVAALGAFASLGWREAAADRVGMAARALLFVVPVLVFVAVWAVTPLGNLADLPGHDATRIAWYVMVTEWVVFIGGHAFRDVEDEISSGAVGAALTRPLPYALATLAEWLGAGAYRLLALGAIGFAVTGTATGTVPFDAVTLPILVLTVAAGAGLMLLLQLGTGLLTAWLSTPAPFFWVWQKLAFIFGGLLIPLTLYPPLIRAIGEVTPFAAIMFHPASLVFEAGPAAVARVVAWQALWLVVIGLTVTWLAGAATRRFVRDGV
jgi:ABC-2 type transport system permease protein